MSGIDAGAGLTAVLTARLLVPLCCIATRTGLLRFIIYGNGARRVLSGLDTAAHRNALCRACARIPRAHRLGCGPLIARRSPRWCSTEARVSI